MIPSNLPLWVTRVCLRPNLRNISTTVSIGVWLKFKWRCKPWLVAWWSLPGLWWWWEQDPQFSSVWGAEAHCPPLEYVGWTHTGNCRAKTPVSTLHSQMPAVSPVSTQIQQDTGILWISQIILCLKGNVICVKYFLPWHNNWKSVMICVLQQLLKLGNCCRVLNVIININVLWKISTCLFW